MCNCAQCTADDWRYPMAAFRDERLRYVLCEHCGGTGEIIKGTLGEPWDDFGVLCSACDGYGMECVETEPVTIDDLD